MHFTAFLSPCAAADNSSHPIALFCATLPHDLGMKIDNDCSENAGNDEDSMKLKACSTSSNSNFVRDALNKQHTEVECLALRRMLSCKKNASLSD